MKTLKPAILQGFYILCACAAATAAATDPPPRSWHFTAALDGRANARGTPFAYWDQRFLTEPRLLNSQTGEFQAVTMTRDATQNVSFHGRMIPAQRYSLRAPKLDIDLWYSASGGTAHQRPPGCLRQLAQFRAAATHRGRTCRAGLWRYSRHPNYFFEWLHCFSYVALAVAAPAAWYALCGPVLMYVFLRWISGVSYTEAQALRSRGDEYREHQRSTSVLIPWWPRRV